MDEEEFEEKYTPPKLEKVTTDITSNLLSEKSKHIYMNVYHEFMKWCISKETENYTENVFIEYFSERSNKCKPSTLWSHYSMLKTTFNLHNSIDIGKFGTLLTFLKRASENHKPKKSKLFTLEEMEKFIDEAPDKQFLMMKVAAIFGIYGACHRHELCEILIDDIQDSGTALIIHIRECKNKIARTFTVVDSKDRNPNFLEIYRRNHKCTKQPVGINQFGKIPSKIATFLKLSHPNLYTGHCFRRSSASLLADSGIWRKNYLK